MTNSIGIVVADGSAKRRSIRASLSEILATEDSMLPHEFSGFRTAVSDAIRIFDETIEANGLGDKQE